jgi:hypothetical protein
MWLGFHDEEDGRMVDANLVGGSPEDRRRLLARMGEYLDANARFDWEKLQEIWSPAGEAVFFNLNGHTYRGRAHWTRLWRYYKENVASGYWTPFDIGGVVSDALAVIWCERQTHSDWVGTDPMPTRPPARISFRARQWCFARKATIGASCTCISRRPAKVRVRAGYERGPPSAARDPRRWGT